MKKIILLFSLALFGFLLSSCGGEGGGGDAPENADIKISTSLGDIYIQLYDDTPKHKENFLKLAGEKFYDGTLFHRVIPNFMIQTGDPDSKKAQPGQMLGNGGPGYDIPAEIRPQYYHLRGAVSAARLPDQQNPEWKSSGSQFFIVTGKTVTDEELTQLENGINQQILIPRRQAVFNALPENKWARGINLEALRESNPDSFKIVTDKLNVGYQAFLEKEPLLKYSDEIRAQYKSQKGFPTLDYMYTVFGKVVKGIEVADKISNRKRDGMDRPEEDISMTVTVLKK